MRAAVERAIADAAAQGMTTIELWVDDLVGRRQAVLLGFEGGLRRPLRRAVAGSAGAPRSAVEEIAALLPDLTVRPGKATLRGAFFGRATVQVTFPDGVVMPVNHPDSDELLPEAVALCIDTAHRVRAAFGAAVPKLQLRFEQMEGHVAGSANSNVGLIHMNDDAVRADSARHRPWQVVEATMAHELWHHMEALFRGRHRDRCAAFRRDLGAHFGVETLEHVIQGGHPRAPEPWRAAHGRLVAEVSAYAGTNIDEVTAELFKHWWCRPEPKTPAVAAFGELVEQYLLSG